MAEKPKVLFVDDELINRHIAERALRNSFDVIVSEEGGEALEILQNDPSIQLIITDLHMPGMNGLEFIQAAQQQSSHRQFFILSGYAMTKEIQEAIAAKQVVDYFEKPADFERIQAALKSGGVQ